MIYSENIDKICAYCLHAEPTAPDAERTQCTLYKKEVGKTDPACAGVRQLQRHKTLPNRIAVEFFCQIF